MKEVIQHPQSSGEKTEGVQLNQHVGNFTPKYSSPPHHISKFLRRAVEIVDIN